MLIIVSASALLIGGTAAGALVPGRLQSVAEMSYEFVANTMRSSAGNEGMKFFPFVFTLFMFVLLANMIGLIPYSFTVTSQLIITATLALLVFFIVVIYGFWRNGLNSSSSSSPRACRSNPAGDRCDRGALVRFAADLPQRPAVRQHAGRPYHAAGVRRLHHHARRASASVGWLGAAIPLVLVIMLTALEFLVAFLQAYVFAILTCIYLNDAIHPGH